MNGESQVGNDWFTRNACCGAWCSLFARNTESLLFSPRFFLVVLLYLFTQRILQGRGATLGKTWPQR